MKKLLLILLCLSLTNLAAQQENAKPKVGVVLSGGGAKGLAHIGVLKVLEEAGAEGESYVIVTTFTPLSDRAASSVSCTVECFACMEEVPSSEIIVLHEGHDDHLSKMHSMCRLCTRKSISVARDQERAFTCPMCRLALLLPPNGLSNFP